jgi:hypothetical protein
MDLARLHKLFRMPDRKHAEHRDLYDAAVNPACVVSHEAYSAHPGAGGACCDITSA